LNRAGSIPSKELIGQAGGGALRSLNTLNYNIRCEIPLIFAGSSVSLKERPSALRRKIKGNKKG
jgi:hypothetical protein